MFFPERLQRSINYCSKVHKYGVRHIENLIYLKRLVSFDFSSVALLIRKKSALIVVKSRGSKVHCNSKIRSKCIYSFMSFLLQKRGKRSSCYNLKIRELKRPINLVWECWCCMYEFIWCWCNLRSLTASIHRFIPRMREIYYFIYSFECTENTFIWIFILRY